MLNLAGLQTLKVAVNRFDRKVASMRLTLILAILLRVVEDGKGKSGDNDGNP